MPQKEPYPATAVEWLVSYVSLGWGIVMLVNTEVFNRSENFSQLAIIAGKEWTIGVICLILATIKVTGILSKQIKLRWIGLILSTVFWIFVSATFLLSSQGYQFNTGFIVYSAIAVMCLWTSKEVLAYDRAN